MAEDKGNRAVEVAHEPPEKQTYKVICGTFKARNEALQRAVEVRKAGVNVSLVIKNAEYRLLYADGMTKAEADAAKKVIESKKVKAEVSEQ